MNNSKEMDEKEQAIITKAKGLLQVGWWLLLLYMLAVFGWIYHDSRINTEYYATVDNLPDKSQMTLIDGYYVSFTGVRIPSWQYEASTPSQCKPLTRISQLWNQHAYIMLGLVIFLTIVRLILDNWDKIKKLEKLSSDEEL